MSDFDANLDLSAQTIDYVTFKIADQLFGVPITSINDMFSPKGLTPVPLADDMISGVLNLRGRIVTAIDARVYLGLPAVEDDVNRMAIGIERSGESYGIIIDSVGEVMRLTGDLYEANPVNLDPEWQKVSKGVYRLDGDLLIVLDVDRLLQVEEKKAVA